LKYSDRKIHVESSEPTQSTRAETTAFLQENQSLAYTVRELSDEILALTWERIHAEECEIARVGEDPYHQQNPDHELDMVVSFLNREKENRIWNILDDLIYEGIVEMQFVSGEQTGIPNASSEVPCNTCSSEVYEVYEPDWWNPAGPIIVPTCK
jgi:hypothetical protein